MFKIRKSMIAVFLSVVLAFCVGACGLIEKKNFNDIGVKADLTNTGSVVSPTATTTPVVATSTPELVVENSDEKTSGDGKEMNQDNMSEEISYEVEEDKKNGNDGGVTSGGFIMPGFDTSDTEAGNDIITKWPDPVSDYYDKISAGYEPIILISEVMSSNKSFVPVNGENYDWVEVYNNSDEVINLSDYYLTDNAEKTRKYQLPDVELESGEYYIIYCSGLDLEGHASFKISSEGESLFLYNSDSICDLAEIPSDLKSDKSYGRYKGKFVYMDYPTPGKKNKKGYDHAFEAPVASIPSGLYEEAVDVELTGEGTIYYTLDGSRPDKNSAQYEKPIHIDDVSTIRTYCVKGDRTSELAAYTYVVDKEHTLPVLTVSIPQEYLFGDNGIIDQFSATIEKEAVMTLIEDGEEKFTIPCGFRLHGNDSRKGKKQNFQIRFRSKYGAGKLHYKLFDDIDIDVFNSLLLKGGSEDYRYAMVRDELCTGIVRGNTELSALSCKPCVLYLGDQYWGIYYIRERFSADYVASHFDVSKESVDLLFTMGLAQDGSSRDYSSLVNYVKTHDLTVEENYKYVTDRVEITSLMDWYICRSYMGDKDYANIRYFKSSEYDNKWRYMYFDLDWAFWTSQDTPVTSILGNTNLNVMIYNLMKNKDFQKKFLLRYAELLQTILNDEFITSQLDDMLAVIEDEMPRDRERWGYSMKEWRDQINKIYRINSDGSRTANVLKDIKDYFNLTDKQMKKYFKNVM